jgi:hypothetical protein
MDEGPQSESSFARSQRVNSMSPRPKTQVRGFGLFLIGSQVVALIVLAASYASVEEITSGRALLNPATFGIAIAGLWSFPILWNRLPSLLQKSLLLVLVVILQATFWMLLTLEAARKLAAAFGAGGEKYLALPFAGSMLCSGAACLVILFRRKKPRQASALGSGPQARQREQVWANVPSVTYADVGGMERQKERIRAVVRNRLHPERYYGVVQH